MKEEKILIGQSDGFIVRLSMYEKLRRINNSTMPTLCALYQGKLLICLSGNPFGATANLELLVRPVLAKMTGRKDLRIVKKRAICQSEFSKKSFVTRYVRAYYDGSNVQMGKGSNASGILSSMCGCNCLIEIPAGTERLDVGDEVEVVLL